MVHFYVALLRLCDLEDYWGTSFSYFQINPSPPIARRGTGKQYFAIGEVPFSNMSPWHERFSNLTHFYLTTSPSTVIMPHIVLVMEWIQS